MGVVFDEVVAEVEAPTQAAEGESDQGEQPQSLQAQAHQWRQQQATFQRRQLRLDAD